MSDMAKNIVLWIIIAVVLMSVFNNFSGQKTAAHSLPYSEFLQLVREGNVSNVVISGRDIEGQLSSGSRFSTFSPGDDGLISDLVKHNVEFKATPPEKPSVLMQIMINWFPLFILIGLWIFLMRQMQGGPTRRSPASGARRWRRPWCYVFW